ncbi:EPOR protein, partial [Cettia cetti]|nr:EPOR protein [Cettia cetti]
GPPCVSGCLTGVPQVGVPAGRRQQGVGGLRGSTPYTVRARARPDGLSYGGFWSAWSRPGTATTGPGE